MFIPRINCKVEDCEYCNNINNTCILSSITVETTKNKRKCSKDNTFCNNYKKMSFK